MRHPGAAADARHLHLNTSVVDESLSHSYDQWVKAIHFDVVQGIPRESGGVVVMNSRWENLHPDR